MPNNDYRDYLMHHGILGQKWGVRRYQNADGSLTPKGQKRYNKQQKKEQKIDRKQAVKNRRIMPESELQTRIKRLQDEKKLKELTDKDLKPGKTASKSVIGKAGKIVVTAAITGALAYSGKKFLLREGHEELAKYMFPNPHKKK